LTAAELGIVMAAVVAGAVTKSVTGLGLPIIAIPVMALFIDVVDAVVVMAIPTVAANVLLVREHRVAWPEARPRVVVLLVTGVIGAVVGALLLARLDPRILTLTLAALVLAYVATRLFRSDFDWPPAVARRGNPIVGALSGVLQGATGISGPLLATWVHGLRLPRQVFVLSITLLFTVLGMAQLVGLTVAGLWTWERLAASLAALVPVLVVVPVGVRLARGLPAEVFDRVVLVVLSGSAVALVLRSLV